MSPETLPQAWSLPLYAQTLLQETPPSREARPAMTTERPPYPMRGAIFIPIHQLDIPATAFRHSGERTQTNHHYLFTANMAARFIITQTFRDLAANQEVLPRAGHNWLHNNFYPPKLPNLGVIMERLDNALDAHEMLRYGTAHLPQLAPMTQDLWTMCDQEYSQIHLIDRAET